jgi:tetratricopeptide (TPR) repeat protein
MEDLAGAEEFGNEAMKVSVERGYPFFLGIASYVLGWAKGHAGDFEESMRLFDQGITVWNAMGSLVWRTLPYTWKIQVHIEHGDFAGARETLDAAYREVEQTEERFALCVLWRLEADILLGLAKTSSEGTNGTLQAGISVKAQAEELYRKAIANAREREAKSFELPALLSLYALLKDSPEAADVLSEIQSVYDSYPDGHELPLLQRARAVLNSVEDRSSKVLTSA